MSDMEVLICGNIAFDTLNRKEKDDQIIEVAPKFIEELKGASAVAASMTGAHFMVIKEGTVYGFGKNESGQVGIGEPGPTVCRPTLITALASHVVVKVACGRRHTLFLTDKGEVFGCGRNDHGQLGNGRTTDIQKAPVKAEITEVATGISAGTDYSMVLSEDGSLYSFGYPEHGRLGLNDDGCHLEKGNKYTFEKNPNPTKVGKDEGPWKAVSCGATHCVALSVTGLVYTWGEGSFGRLGNGRHSNDNQLKPEPVDTADIARFKLPTTKIFAGRTSNLLVLKNECILVWGRLRSTNDAKPRPTYDMDFSGAGTINCVTYTGEALIFVADNGACCQGTGTCKQLALSVNKGSTSKPDYCALLEDVFVEEVAGSQEATIWLVKRDKEGAKTMDKLETVDFDEVESKIQSREATATSTPGPGNPSWQKGAKKGAKKGAAGTKRKEPAAAKKPAAKKKKATPKKK